MTWDQKLKSKGLNLGEYGGQWCSVCLEITRSPNLEARKERTIGGGAVLLEPELPPCGSALDGRSDNVLEHSKVGGSVHTSLEPVDWEDLPVHNAHPGHDL